MTEWEGMPDTHPIAVTAWHDWIWSGPGRPAARSLRPCRPPAMEDRRGHAAELLCVPADGHTLVPGRRVVRGGRRARRPAGGRHTVLVPGGPPAPRPRTGPGQTAGQGRRDDLRRSSRGRVHFG